MKTRVLRYLQPLLFAALGATAFATILPADRTIDWSLSGVPGGIPNRTTIFCNVTQAPYNAVGNDSTDNRAALQAAFNACPSGQVVFIPAGIYRVNGVLNVPSNITVRGAGQDVTIIKAVGAGAGLFILGNGGVSWDPTSVTTTISSGTTAGSTSITVASSSGISVGTYLVITEVNDSSFVRITTDNGTASWVDGWSTGGTRSRGQIVRVTGVSGTNISFAPALYTAYPNTPWASRFTASCSNSGVESLTAYATNSGTMRNFLFQGAEYCWLYDVKGDFTDGDHATIDWSYRCEIRHSYFKDAFIHSSGQYDTQIGLRYKSTGCLIVDNIIERLHLSFVAEWGAAGNVIAYNYALGEYDDSAGSGNRWLPMSLNSNHGAHPQFNLFEGNISQRFVADSYWGSSSHTTVFRNWFQGHGSTYPPYSARGTPGASIILNQDNKAIDLWQIQSKYSVVGNILGDSTLVGALFKIIDPALRSYTAQYIWSLGYETSADSGGTAPFENPALTVIDHGNYDYVNHAITWNPTILDHSIPSSLFLASKPAWFGSLTWPAFDPTSPNPNTDAIPAGYRFNHGTEAPGVGAPQPPSNALIKIN